VATDQDSVIRPLSVCQVTVELSRKGEEGKGVSYSCFLQPPVESLSPSGSDALFNVSGLHRDNWVILVTKLLLCLLGSKRIPRAIV
jgi:hypothetical protein